MAACGALHSQVASVMEVLANAAVAEICKLVDEGFALLRLEVSQKQKENRALRRRIHVMQMELKMARGEGGYGARDSTGTGDQEGVEVGTADTAQQLDTRRNQCAGVMEEASGQLFIKQENCGEDSTHKCTQEEVMAAKENTRELGADATDQQTSASRSAEEVGDELRSRRAVWEVSGSKAVLKAEPEKEGANRRPLYVASESRAERAHGLDPESMIYEKAAQTFSSQRAAGINSDTPWLFASETDSESLLVPSDVWTISAQEDGAGVSVSSAGSPDRKSDVVAFDIVPVKTEHDTLLRDKKTISGTVSEQHKLYSDSRGRVETNLENGTNLCSLDMKTRIVSDSNGCVSGSFALAKSGETQGKSSSKDKRFLCAFCGKGFSCPKKVEIHQRVHTGEKPFSCTQCRMRFAQSGNLKRHQRVHTGEKPFSCSQCDKRFSHLHQLKMHERVHSGERPFCCTFCGKRFGEKSYLRIHQQKSHLVVLGAV